MPVLGYHTNIVVQDGALCGRERLLSNARPGTLCLMAWCVQIAEKMHFLSLSTVLSVKLSSGTTLEFTSTTLEMMFSPLLHLSGLKKEKKKTLIVLLLTESVLVVVHTLAGTRLLHHPSINSQAQQDPQQTPNRLTGWHRHVYSMQYTLFH